MSLSREKLIDYISSAVQNYDRLAQEAIEILVAIDLKEKDLSTPSQHAVEAIAAAALILGIDSVDLTSFVSVFASLEKKTGRLLEESTILKQLELKLKEENVNIESTRQKWMEEVQGTSSMRDVLIEAIKVDEQRLNKYAAFKDSVNDTIKKGNAELESAGFSEDIKHDVLVGLKKQLVGIENDLKLYRKDIVGYHRLPFSVARTRELLDERKAELERKKADIDRLVAPMNPS